MSLRDQYSNELSKLMAFGPGGAFVADAPKAQPPPVNGLPVGGVSEAVAWFLEGLRDNLTVRILFLVGAPGNGKSFWSREVAKRAVGVGLIDGSQDRRDIQMRKHQFLDTNNQCQFELVNDATMPSISGDSTPTINDLATAIQNDRPMLVNINRGVFYEELVGFKSDLAEPDQILAATIMESLRSGKNPELSPALGRLTIRDSETNPHEPLRALRIDRIDRKSILVLAVQMDLHSILAACSKYKPDVGFFGTPVSDSAAPGYRLLQPFSAQFRDRQYWRQTPAGLMFDLEIQRLAIGATTELSDLNPIRSNLELLTQTEFYCGALASLRNAEIVSSRHFAFRHMWTATFYLILGDLRQLQGASAREVLEAVDARASRLMSEEDPIQRLWEMVDLAQLRSHQALYGANWSHSLAENPIRQKQLDSVGILGSVRDVMKMADPVIDNYKLVQIADQPVEWGQGVRNAFLNALTDTDASSIVESAFRACHGHESELRLVSPFDRELDRCVLAVLRADQGESPLLSRDVRDALIAWYGDYVTRMIALSIGATAWSREIDEFVRTWRHATNNEELPDKMFEKLLSYVLPCFEDAVSGNQRRLVTLLRSRTEPIRVLEGEQMLAYELPRQLLIRARVRGDRLVAELFDANQRHQSAVTAGLFSVEIDARIIRELNVHAHSSDSCSDVSDSIRPLVERYRALSTTKLQQWRLVTRNGVETI